MNEDDPEMSVDELFVFIVDITAKGRRGRRLIHTFALLRTGYRWCPQAVLTKKQRRAAQREEDEREQKRSQGIDPGHSIGWLKGPSLPQPAPLDTDYVFHIADGVDIPSGSLVLLLEALRRTSPRRSSGGRREVDLEVVKALMSEYGARLASAREAPRHTWESMLLPLYDDISRRCSTLEASSKRL